MLGNDIVDLKLAATQSNWRRRGYLQKIFTEQEQVLIANAPDQDQMVWLLWSMKEAAYKIVNRQTLEQFYSPQLFFCNVKNNVGEVIFNEEIFYTESTIKPQFIHTVAVKKKQLFSEMQTTFLPNEVDYLADFNSANCGYFLAKDLNGMPFIVNKLGDECFASITHHGEYLALIYSSSDFERNGKI